ncbi:chloroplast unusual positioning protein, partial [Musa troglodytarum]
KTQPNPDSRRTKHSGRRVRTRTLSTLLLPANSSKRCEIWIRRRLKKASVECERDYWIRKDGRGQGEGRHGVPAQPRYPQGGDAPAVVLFPGFPPQAVGGVRRGTPAAPAAATLLERQGLRLLRPFLRRLPAPPPRSSPARPTLPCCPASWRSSRRRSPASAPSSWSRSSSRRPSPSSLSARRRSPPGRGACARRRKVRASGGGEPGAAGRSRGLELQDTGRRGGEPAQGEKDQGSGDGAGGAEEGVHGAEQWRIAATLRADGGDRRLLVVAEVPKPHRCVGEIKSFQEHEKSPQIHGHWSGSRGPEAGEQRSQNGRREGEAASRPARGGEKEDALRPRAPRVPKPPPTPSISCNSSTSSSSSSSSTTSETTSGVPTSRGPSLASLPPIPPPAPAVGPALTGCPRPPPPPPPPPPPSKGSRLVAASVRRVPEVVEFYHSLMRRDSKREPGGVAPDVAPASSAAAANARDMIGEIENRSAHLLAIKTDVETQGDFIRFLIKEVEHAAFTNVEDVVAFVKWLDDELSFLVDERAVLKHFEWPEHKADAMREAAFGYCDLKKLVSEASSLRDGPRQPCASALKKMQALLEKLEQGVYNLSRVREGSTKRYKGFGIPWEWMLESGYVNQIKLASVKLAMKYMKRVSSELENIAGSPEEEELMLQGVRFAFRVHQFAGGFDVETMRAFQELKDKAHSLRLQSPHHHHHKLYCRSTSR